MSRERTIVNARYPCVFDSNNIPIV
jgi:hypothetical protein